MDLRGRAVEIVGVLRSKPELCFAVLRCMPKMADPWESYRKGGLHRKDTYTQIPVALVVFDIQWMTSIGEVFRTAQTAMQAEDDRLTADGFMLANSVVLPDLVSSWELTPNRLGLMRRRPVGEGDTKPLVHLYAGPSGGWRSSILKNQVYGSLMEALQASDTELRGRGCVLDEVLSPEVVSFASTFQDRGVPRTLG